MEDDKLLTVAAFGSGGNCSICRLACGICDKDAIGYLTERLRLITKWNIRKISYRIPCLSCFK